MTYVFLGLLLTLSGAACVGALLAFQASRTAARALAERETRPETTLERLQETENNLARLLQNAVADMAARLEKVKGDLRQETADRLSEGLLSIRDGVAKQLETGRREQTDALARVSATLDEKMAQSAQLQARGLADAREETAKRLVELREEMTKALGQTTRTLEEKFENLSKKVEERLQIIADQVQKKLDQNIKEGFAQFEKVQEHLKTAEERLKEVGQVGASIHNLNALLKMPHLRGRFGEITLENLLADFFPREMYELQSGIGTDDRLRADALILLPDRKLPIDSKFPREQVQALFESGNPAEEQKARKELEVIVKKQAADITKYIKPEEGTTEMALMFLPSETLWFEVIQNSALSAHLNKLRVFPVSPNTLLATLHSIRLSHKWYEIARGFEDTRQEVEKARKSFGFFRAKFEDIGKQLEKAQSSYQVAASHFLRYRSRVTKLTGEQIFELEGPEDGSGDANSGDAAQDS